MAERVSQWIDRSKTAHPTRLECDLADARIEIEAWCEAHWAEFADDTENAQTRASSALIDGDLLGLLSAHAKLAKRAGKGREGA